MHEEVENDCPAIVSGVKYKDPMRFVEVVEWIRNFTRNVGHIGWTFIVLFTGFQSSYSPFLIYYLGQGLSYLLSFSFIYLFICQVPLSRELEL